MVASQMISNLQSCSKTKKEYRIYNMSDMPRQTRPEVVLIGRSNVGKSSLLNALLARKIAKVSKTPGKTLWLGIHDFHNCHLIDMPGYGYAQTSESRKNIVNSLVSEYFRSGRASLVFLLIDLRRGLQPIDLEIIDYIQSAEVKIVGTKADSKDAKDFGFELNISSHNGTKISELKNFIIQFCDSCKFQPSTNF